MISEPKGRGIDQPGYSARFAEDGYATFPHVLSLADVKEIRAAIEGIPAGEGVRQKKSVYGVRNLLETSSPICRLATRPEVWELVTLVLGESAFACRALFFDKTPDANWMLGWHQDRMISVSERIETPGFHAWRQKAGVWHVQPPSSILTTMLSIRIHLDDCGIDNGALRVIPGSHHRLILEPEMESWKRDVPEVACPVPLGGILVMRPLILHASSKSIAPRNRRVVHVEYANQSLPNGLNWSRQIRPS